MMTSRASVIRIGHEGEPVIELDGFAANPAALLTHARGADFTPAGEHYPGVRAPVPPDYLARQLPLIARAVGRHMGRVRQLRVVDASFSIVTTPPAALTVGQRVPHVDAHGADRLALIHYLSDHPEGTAFYRHRSTGWETVGADRAIRYDAALADELGRHAPAPGYLRGDTPVFERTHLAAAWPNRALIYRGHLLHSGDIGPDTELSPDPARGRLTITGFFVVE